MRYEATYSFNVRRHLRVTIDADSPEEAERIAKADAMKHIDAEIVAIQNSDGFSDTDVLDAHLTLDAIDAADYGSIAVIEGEPLGLDEDSKNNGR